MKKTIPMIYHGKEVSEKIYQARWLFSTSCKQERNFWSVPPAMPVFRPHSGLTVVLVFRKRTDEEKNMIKYKEFCSGFSSGFSDHSFPLTVLIV